MASYQNFILQATLYFSASLLHANRVNVSIVMFHLCACSFLFLEWEEVKFLLSFHLFTYVSPGKTGSLNYDIIFYKGKT